MEIQRHASSPWLERAAVAAVVVFGTILPRLALIGGPPVTDEGIYAFHAQLIHAGLSSGQGLPNDGPLMLYPLLVSWVFHFSANPFVLLRFFDLLVAAAASCAFCIVLQRESRGKYAGNVIAFVFLSAMNRPEFIQFGFKNPIFCAYLALFSSFLLVQQQPSRPERWYLAGVLTGLAVLLRETFLPLAAAAAVAALLVERRSGLRFLIGAIVIGLSGLGAACIARGGVGGLITGYSSLAVTYAALDHSHWHLFVRSGRLAFFQAIDAIIAGTVGGVLAVRAATAPEGAALRHRLLFWLAMTFVPLWEPAAKAGYAYHFAVCLPGLAGLAAFGWRWRGPTPLAKPARRYAFAAAAGATALVTVLNAVPIARHWPSSMRTLSLAQSGTWPPEVVARSNYLRAGAAIRAVAGPHDTLSVSGYMLALFPETGLMPPSYRLANLSDAVIAVGLSEPSLRAQLVSCPPDILMTTTQDLPGSSAITAAVESLGLYRPVAVIAVVPDVPYGNFGGTIYRRIAARRVGCRI